MHSKEKSEYLAKLLSFAVGVKAENEAEKILSAYQSYSDIASASSNIMQNLSGCSEQTADFIRLVSAISSRRVTDEFKLGRKYSKQEVERDVCALLFHLSVESVYLISFDKLGKLIAADLISEGTINSSAFLPRKMLDLALRRKASSVVLAHNHPSGNPLPSENDIAVTLLAKEVLNDVHIEFSAHYISVGFSIYDCLETILHRVESYGSVSRIDPLV